MFCSLGSTVVTFKASNENYPGGYALKHLHDIGKFSLSLSLSNLLIAKKFKGINLHLHCLVFLVL